MDQEIPPSAGFKDRKTGLNIFGFLTLAAGGLCALFVPLMFLAQSMPRNPDMPPQNPQAMYPAMIIYGVLAIVLIWLGVGSIMARRWARALILILSWSWLIMGIVALAFMIISEPQIAADMQQAHRAGQPEVPASALEAGMVVFMGVIFVILPAIWIFFYGSKQTKATCEARDPVVRWTDRCPLPVLGLCIWLGWCLPMMLVAAVMFHPVLPFFGMFLTGIAGIAEYLFLIAAWAYSVWALYKLDMRGWWVLFITKALFGISGFLTYCKHDPSELYQLMGFPEQQIARMQKFNFFQGGRMAWVVVFFEVPWLCYLIYVRKFFPRKD
jgi:hypothetical protein